MLQNDDNIYVNLFKNKQKSGIINVSMLIIGKPNESLGRKATRLMYKGTMLVGLHTKTKVY